MDVIDRGKKYLQSVDIIPLLNEKSVDVIPNPLSSLFLPHI